MNPHDPYTALQRIQSFAPQAFQPQGTFWFELVAAYGSPGRYYHTLQHIEEMAELYSIAAKEVGWEKPREVFLAVLAHDVVYDVARTDNEAVSAQWGARWAMGLKLDALAVASLIRATASHTQEEAVLAEEPDLGLFLDCDLAILGAPAERYDDYERGVAAEYRQVHPEFAYRSGRTAFLESMLAREHVFHTPFFQDNLEPRARQNMERAWKALQAG